MADPGQGTIVHASSVALLFNIESRFWHVYVSILGYVVSYLNDFHNV